MLEHIDKMLLIDKNSLDKECVEFSSIYNKVLEKVAEVLSVRDAAKEEIDAVSAKVGEDIRKTFEQKGEKITEARLVQLIQIDERRVKAFEEWLLRKLEADFWIAKEKSFEKKAMMLKEVGELYRAGYFSEITIKGEFNKIKEKDYQMNKDRINSMRKGQEENVE